MVSRVFDETEGFHGGEVVCGGLDRLGVQQGIRGDRGFSGKIFCRSLRLSGRRSRYGSRKASYLLALHSLGLNQF